MAKTDWIEGADQSSTGAMTFTSENTAATVFDFQTLSVIGTMDAGKRAFVDATQNADGSYTISNNNEVWAGPLSNANEFGNDNLSSLTARFINPYTGVLQLQIGGAGPGPNGSVPPPNGVLDSTGANSDTVYGQIVAWDGDSILIKLYNSLNTNTGQLGDPIVASANQAAYLLVSAEDMTGTDGIPTNTGATLGQSTDPATLAALSNNLGISPQVPAAPVDNSGMMDALGNNLPSANAAWVQVTQQSDGTFSATMQQATGTFSSGYVDWSDSRYDFAGNVNILQVFGNGIFEYDVSAIHEGHGFGKIIGWNADGILFENYGTYSNGQLTNVSTGVQQFGFLSENNLQLNPFLGSPEVFGQDPDDFPVSPVDFGLAPPSPPTSAGPIDPSSISAIGAHTFGGFPSAFTGGHIVLSDATQNADGSYTLSFGGESWDGAVIAGVFNDVSLSIAVNYSDGDTGAVDFSFATTNGSPLPAAISGEFFGKIVGWDADNVLLQLYGNLDKATGVLSNPIDPSQGAPYMLISANDITGLNGQGAGTIDGMTLGQPSDSETLSQLRANMGVSPLAPASNVDLPGLQAALEGKSSNFGAFVNVTNLGNGAYSATATYHPSVYIAAPPYAPYYAGANDYGDFSDVAAGADGVPGFTIHIDNVFSGGVFEWELDNPNPMPSSTNPNPDGPAVVDHFYAKVIGYNADGVLVENYAMNSNGVLNGLATGFAQYAYFSTNDLQNTDIQDTPAQFGQDQSQLPNGLGVVEGPPPPPPPALTAADVFDMLSVRSFLSGHNFKAGQISLLDATQNGDGSYTVTNGGENWSGPMSGGNQFGDASAQVTSGVFFLNLNTGVIQLQLANGTTPPPNGLPAQNGQSQGVIQGQIVAWNGDSILIKLYGALDTNTGQLSDPLTSGGGQAAYVLISSEDMTATNGLPSNPTLGQSTDPATLQDLTDNLGFSQSIPAAPVDPSGMVEAIGGDLNTDQAAYVKLTVNGDGTFSATMPGVPYNTVSQAFGLNDAEALTVAASFPGGVIQINTSNGNPLGFGKIIGWNADGVLLEMYGSETNGVLGQLANGANRFMFFSGNNLAINPISSDAPEVFTQDPNNFPANFGLAVPAAPPPVTLDPASIAAIPSLFFGNDAPTLVADQLVLTNATQNADGSYTLSTNEPWAGAFAPADFASRYTQLTITESYSNDQTGAVDLTFGTVDGSALPGTIGNNGEIFAKIVAWDSGDILLQLYGSLDKSTGILSNPIDPSQGPSYLLISAQLFLDAGRDTGILDGQTLGQPTDSGTLGALQSSLAVSTLAPASDVDLSGLQAALDGQSSNFGAFVQVTNLGNGHYTATDNANPYNHGPITSSFPVYYTQAGYGDFTDVVEGTGGDPHFTIKIDNIFSGGVFEWELDNPNPAPTFPQQNTPVVDHFFAKIIGYNSDGILVENYAMDSHGQLTGLATGFQQYAYFSVNDLQSTDIQTTPAQFGQDQSQLPNGLGVNAPCFAAGTRIRTERGEVAVENLQVGDRVETVSGKLRRVKWIGHRHVDCTRHPDPEKVWPIRVETDAFGPGLPQRDLFVSPDHALFLEGVLIPAIALVNDDTVAQKLWDDVTYYHVELESHDVLLAEGLPAESFLDTGNRDSFANGEVAMRLHADFTPGWTALVWEAQSCAPLVVDGPELEAARARLQHRIEATACHHRVAA